MSNETHAKKAKIIIMLGYFPATAIGENTVDIYASTVEGCTLAAVTAAVDEFRSGRAPLQSLKWAPAPLEFADRAKLHDDAITMRLALGERPALPPPPKLVITPAMRAKASKLLLRLANDMRSKNDRVEREDDKRVFRGSSAEERGDPRPLAERLRLTA